MSYTVIDMQYEGVTFQWVPSQGYFLEDRVDGVDDIFKFESKEDVIEEIEFCIISEAYRVNDCW